MQSERYFQSIPDIIHQDFDLTCFESANTKSLLEKVQLPNTVSLQNLFLPHAHGHTGGHMPYEGNRYRPDIPADGWMLL